MITHTLIEDFGLGDTKEELRASLEWLETLDQDDCGVQVAIRHVTDRLDLHEKLERGEEIEGP